MNLHILFILLSIGLIAGFIDSVAGGGGMITLPVYLLIGLPAHLALGTNKLSSTLSVANAARIFIRKRIFKPRFWLIAAIATGWGALLGSIVVHFIPNHALQAYIPIILLLLAVYILLPKKLSPTQHSLCRPDTFNSCWMGLTLGFYDGFLGPGVGSFWAVLLMSLLKMEMIEATAVAKLMNFTSNLIACIVFIVCDNVNYLFGITMALAMMCGAYIGAHSAIRFGAGFIRPVLLISVVVMALRLAWLYWI